jgi:alpha-ketoglutarate-dependent taurine dioxygenase
MPEETPMKKPMICSFPGKKTILPRRVPSGTSAGSAEAADFPLIIMSQYPGQNLAERIRDDRNEIDCLILRHGAVLFRGFDVTAPEHFSKAMAVLDPEILSYTERSSPRHKVADNVYTSTDHPHHQDIVLHSEQSYTLDWPCLISFTCQRKAMTGGNTPIADNRKVLRHLPTGLRDRFERHGVLYMRTYTPGLGVRWQTAFQTESRAEVERFCAERNIVVEWLPDGRLRTRQKRSAFQKHPVSGEVLWFNHALFFHHTSLEPEVAQALIEAVGMDHLPTTTCFGNGEPFSDDNIAAMRAAVAREKRTFEWEERDVLVLDNMICQHGRDPFTGDRTVLTIMGRLNSIQVARQQHARIEPTRPPKVALLSIFADAILNELGDRGKDVIIPKDLTKFDLHALYRQQQFDVLICFGYPKLLPVSDPLFKNVRFFNAHSSLLPYSRGWNPNLCSWINDEPHGVTIQEMGQAYDTGDIVFQKRLTLDPEKETLRSSYFLKIGVMTEFLGQHWEQLVRGDYTPIRQDLGAGSEMTREQLLVYEDIIDQYRDRPISELLQAIKARDTGNGQVESASPMLH